MVLQHHCESPSSPICPISIMSSNNFDHTQDPTFIKTMLNFPPPDNLAWEYGFGLGDSFELDYELFTEAHLRAAPSLARGVSEDDPSGPASPAPSLPLLPPPNTAPVSTEAAPAPSLPLPIITNNNPVSAPDNIPTPPPTPLTTPAGPGRGRRSKFPPAWLEGLARIVYSDDPYSAPHGQKKTAWDNVLAKLRESGMFPESSAETVKNKMSAMLAYFDVSLICSFSSLDLICLFRTRTVLLVLRLHESCLLA